MKMYGGVEGKFNPELNNSRVYSTVIYPVSYTHLTLPTTPYV